MPTKTDWPAAMRPLLEKYKHTRHPLEYGNIYQLLVMVVLSAQATDDAVNLLAPRLFDAYPDMESLSKAKPEELFPFVSKVRNFAHKANWLVAIAKQIGKDAAIPLDMEGLTALPGIGRKSANVIRREAGKTPEGVIVDIHVIRVAPRLGVASDPDPKKMEETLMKKLPQDEWDAGMAMSFLGREICRPQPECERCLMNTVCAYYARIAKAGGKKAPVKKAAAKKAATKTAAAKKAPANKTQSKKAPGQDGRDKKAASNNARIKKAGAKSARSEQASGQDGRDKKARSDNAPVKKASVRKAPAKNAKKTGGKR